MELTRLTLPGEEDFFTQEAYKVLRTNLQFCGQDIRVIAVTSCSENEGKTTVSLHTGKSFAELGKRTLVIDADMRKSVMAGRNTTARNTRGLSEVLTGMNTLEECLHQTQYENLHLLFAGQYPPNPVELLSGTYFSDLLHRVRERYDYVIVDAPPLGRVIDAAVISTNCDGAVLVMGQGRIRRHQAQNVVQQLRKSGCRVLGVIRNNDRKKGVGYYGQKRYYGYQSRKE